MNVGDFSLDPAALENPQAPVHLELAPNELPFTKSARAIVREALIPFLVWENVPVRVVEPRQLGRMEVFLLDAGIELRRFTFDELQQATDVPAQVIAASAEKLVRRRAFVEVQPGEYVVDAAQAVQMLATKNIEEEHLRLLTLVYFPRHDVVMANQEAARQLLRVAKRLRPRCQAPFRADVDRSKDVPSFVARRILENRVVGHAHRILGVQTELWSKPPPWPKLIPCYYARGIVDGTGNDTAASLRIWGVRKRALESEEVKLFGELPLVREWISLTNAFREVFRGSVAGLPTLSAVYVQSAGMAFSWRVGVTQPEANALAADRWLTEPCTISACSSTAKVDIQLSFEPVDAQTSALFAVDAVGRRMENQRLPYSDQNWTEHLRWARERYPISTWVPVTRNLVEDRLWRLKRFMAIYQQRAEEDFAYG